MFIFVCGVYSFPLIRTIATQPELAFTLIAQQRLEKGHQKLFNNPQLWLPRALRNLNQTNEHQLLHFKEPRSNLPSLRPGRDWLFGVLLT